MTDFNNMLKQAQELQKKMADAQKKVEELEAEGTSGGGLVKVKINAEEGVKSSLTEKEFSEIKSLAEIIEMPTITMLWQMLNKGLREISSAFSPISSIEMLVIRIAYLNSMENPDKILNEISNELKMVEKDITKDVSAEDIEIDSKVKEIIDFFPGTKIETIDN